VRLLIVSSCVAAITAGPALACPRHVLCLVQPEVAGASEVPRTYKRATIPDLRRVTVAPDDQLTFEAPVKHDPNEIEMPWIWRVLRDQVYAQMPKYKRKEAFTLVLSPVVVTTPNDTIPGVGVAGGF
jgi:hypothetical protein